MLHTCSHSSRLVSVLPNDKETCFLWILALQKVWVFCARVLRYFCLWGLCFHLLHKWNIIQFVVLQALTNYTLITQQQPVLPQTTADDLTVWIFHQDSFFFFCRKYSSENFQQIEPRLSTWLDTKRGEWGLSIRPSKTDDLSCPSAHISILQWQD